MASGEIELQWADGTHKFNIAKLKCVLELEEKCGCGFAEIYKRLAGGSWHFNDIRETLRLGLIGGGTLPDRAMTLVNRYVDDRPFAENVLPAQAVIMAALVGVAGDNPEKKNTSGEGGSRSIFHDDGRYRRSVIYGLGAAIGFDPRQLDEMTMWELAACVDGVNFANNPEQKFEAPTDQEFDQMLLDYDHLRAARPN